MKRAVMLFSITVLTIFSLWVAYDLSKLPPTYDNGIANLMVEDTMEKTGAINAVTAIVFDFRGYDTLGESFVLFTAVSGATVILRKHKKAKGGH
jgi:multisubunit Na+/H+ antiporter MnhB subunit